MNKRSAAIFPPSPGLCSSSCSHQLFHPFLPSLAPLSLPDFHSVCILSFYCPTFASKKYVFLFTCTNAGRYPSWVYVKYSSLQNSAHPGVCQHSRWGPLFLFFFSFSFFYVKPQCDICSPLLLDKCLVSQKQGGARCTQHLSAEGLRVQSHWC